MQGMEFPVLGEIHRALFYVLQQIDAASVISLPKQVAEVAELTVLI